MDASTAIVYESRPLQKPVEIAGQPIAKLLDLLKNPIDGVRERVRIELGGRKGLEVAAAAKKWAAALDPKDPNYEHNMLEALWIQQYVNVVDVKLLKRELASPDFRAAPRRLACSAIGAIGCPTRSSCSSSSRPIRAPRPP